METWKTIAEAPDYQVSDLGNVRRIKPDRLGRLSGRDLATPLNDRGYPNLNLHVGGRQFLRRVHRLVCEAFHGPAPRHGMEVRHLNGVQTDNRSVNLAWGTPSENRHDTWRHGRERDTIPQLKNQCFVSAVWAASGSLSSLSSRFGVARNTIKKIKTGACAISAGY